MKRILRLATILFLIAMPFFSTQAQGGYVEESVWSNVNPASGQASDFIITSAGEKLFGDIISSYDFANYEKVDFEYKGSVKTYSPVDLKAFGLKNGRFFMSKKLAESSEVEFVQILFTGRLQLDYKRDKYYLDNGSEIQELRSYYQDVKGAGSPKKRHVKLYISTLKINTAGACGQTLTDLIEKSRLEEQDIIQILTQYHECEELPYKLHVVKIPVAKFSPTLNLGVGTELLQATNIVNKFNYAFSNSMAIGVFAGFRLHDFRRSPRSSVDLRMGYMMRSGRIDASIFKGNDLVTASQTFNESSLVIPFSYNFSMLKKGNSDFYMGLVLTGWFSTFQSDLAIMELTATFRPGEIQLVEEEFMTLPTTSVVPGLKVGANFPISSGKKLFTELQVDYFNKFYGVQILALPTININRTYVSFQVGIEF